MIGAAPEESMDRPNQLRRALAPIDRLPGFARTWARSKALGSVVPFVGTGGIHCESLGDEGGVFTLANRRKVRNHIKGVHAAATALLAETATGLVFGWQLPDDKLPLLKSMKLDYVRRAEGSLRAEAQLEPEQVAQMEAQPKGDVRVAVRVTDEDGEEPVRCELVWAWIPKRR